MIIVTADLAALEASIDGTVLAPGAPGYEATRKPAIARFHGIRPQAVVRCECAGDVVETLALARRTGVHVTPRSGGHCFAGRSSTEGIVIDVGPMRSVAVAGGVATVGAGTRLAGLYDALDAHAVTIPAGCGPTVGIAGLTLGGGLGILGRLHGLTCDRLRAAQVVLADGRVVDCDEHRDADLLWALRGAGGGQVGVVTSLVFDPVPAPATTTFRLAWPHAAAAAVLAAWQAWAPHATDALHASARVTARGPSEEAPSVTVAGAMAGAEGDTRALLEELVARVGADPASATFAHLPYHAAKRALAEPGDEGVAVARSELFRRSLPAEAIGALVAMLAEGRGPGESRELAFTPLGGAYNRVPAAATAFAHRDQRFVLEHVGVAPDPRHEWVRRSWRAAHPWGSGRVYPNFPDPDLAGWARAYHGANHERLVRIKHAYDPERVFRFPQSL